MIKFERQFCSNFCTDLEQLTYSKIFILKRLKMKKFKEIFPYVFLMRDLVDLSLKQTESLLTHFTRKPHFFFFNIKNKIMLISLQCVMSSGCVRINLSICMNVNLNVHNYNFPFRFWFYRLALSIMSSSQVPDCICHILLKQVIFSTIYLLLSV